MTVGMRMRVRDSDSLRMGICVTTSFRAERGISVPFAKRKGTRRVKRDAGDARGRNGRGSSSSGSHPPSPLTLREGGRFLAT